MKRPHLLFFVPDSQRADSLGHLGNPAASTPRLDALVASGEAVSFDHAFCQNPVCVPSRCSFMSGLYPHVHGHRTMAHALHPERGQGNLLRSLKADGYFVWWGGKNDLVPGQDGLNDHADVYFKAKSPEDYASLGLEAHILEPESTWRGEKEDDRYYSFMRGVLPGFAPDELFVDVDYATVRAALDFLDRYDREQPLCLFIALACPHPQYAVEPLFYDRINPDNIPDRISAASLTGPEPAIRVGIRERQNLEPTWSEERWRELRRVYLAMCARADHLFGEMVDGLRHKGLWDDTAAFYFSDHGDYTGDYGLVEKAQNSFEDCLTRVPFVFKPPAGIPVLPGIRSSLIELIDFPATVEELAGIQLPHDHFGRSLLPLLDTLGMPHRDAVFCEGGRRSSEDHCSDRECGAHTHTENLYWPRVRTQQEMPAQDKAVMCRTSAFKYVRRAGGDDQLFDLRSDPEERHNRIHDPALADTLASLRERMLDGLIDTADIVPRKLDGRHIKVN
jgi:arylsulfatase A-like enzyme